MNSFFAELKKRRIYRAAVFNLVTAGVMLQVANTVLPAFGTPRSVFTTIFLVLGWAFDLTSASVTKTPESPRNAAGETAHYRRGRMWRRQSRA